MQVFILTRFILSPHVLAAVTVSASFLFSLQCVSLVDALDWNGGVRRRTYNREYRIIGGEDAETNEFPYHAEWDGCGGSLISENVVLTAAHCVADYLPIVDFQLRFGGNVNAGIIRNILGYSVYPGYDSNGWKYDYAMFLIEEPIPSSQIQPIKLNRDANNPFDASDDNYTDEDDDYDEIELTAIGLGLITYNRKNGRGDTPTQLQKLQMSFIPYDVCRYQYDFNIVNEAMICAGGVDGEDQCSGDSGSPVMDPNGRQVGIISWQGRHCAEGDPGVFSRVSFAVDYIDEFICLNTININQLTDSNCSQQKRFPVKIEILTDENPNEIGLTLAKNETSNGNNGFRTLLNIPFDAIQQSESIFNRIVNLLPGYYRLRIFDSDGDGICCRRGNGRYSVSANVTTANPASRAGSDSIFIEERKIEKNGDYEDEDFIDFEITEYGILQNDDYRYLGVTPINGSPITNTALSITGFTPLTSSPTTSTITQTVSNTVPTTLPPTSTITNTPPNTIPTTLPPTLSPDTNNGNQITSPPTTSTITQTAPNTTPATLPPTLSPDTNNGNGITIVVNDKIENIQYHDILINISYGPWPNNLKWTLTEKNTNEIIHTSDYIVAGEKGVHTVRLNNIPNGLYGLLVQDINRENILIADNGIITVYEILGGQQAELIGYHDGNYIWEAEITFQLPRQ